MKVLPQIWALNHCYFFLSILLKTWRGLQAVLHPKVLDIMKGMIYTNVPTFWHFSSQFSCSQKRSQLWSLEASRNKGASSSFLFPVAVESQPVLVPDDGGRAFPWWDGEPIGDPTQEFSTWFIWSKYIYLIRDYLWHIQKVLGAIRYHPVRESLFWSKSDQRKLFKY